MADLGICDSVVVALANAMPNITNQITNAGVVKALTSESNEPAITVLGVRGQDGHLSAKFDTGVYKPTARIRYYQPQVTASGTSKSCSATDHEQSTEVDFQLTRYRQRSFSISKDRIDSLCADANQVYQTGENGIQFNIQNTPVMNEIVNIMMAHIRPLMRDINADAFDDLIAQIGINVRTGLNTASNIPVFNAAGTAFRMDGWTQVLDDIYNNELVGPPIIVGGSLFNRFRLALGTSGNSDGGFDYGQLNANNPFEFYYEPTADSKLATNDFLALAPQAAALVQNVRFRNIQRHGTSQFGTFVLPNLPNFEFDLQVKETDCDDVAHTFILSSSFGVFVKPDIYKLTDRIKGVNGVLRYKATMA